MKRRIALPLAALMALLHCAELDFVYDNPCDKTGTNYIGGCGGGDNGGGGGDDNYVYTGGTVTIGTQTWMAKNLDRATTNSKCYNNSADSCAKYGRLYNWSTAMSACPVGYHLPSDAEWTTLTDYVGDSSTVGYKLKSSTGWYVNYGTDDYRFSALPGGYGNSGGSFGNAGYDGYWWSATERAAWSAWYWSMHCSNEIVYRDYYDKADLRSVRCVQD
jgi:uncharacterized protein (TIGR02145 family)